MPSALDGDTTKRVIERSISFRDLESLVVEALEVAPGLRLSYVDSDGDKILLKSQSLSPLI